VQPAYACLAAVQYDGGGLCIDALRETLTKYGAREIFNSDQGSQVESTQFTSEAFTGAPKGARHRHQ